MRFVVLRFASSIQMFPVYVLNIPKWDYVAKLKYDSLFNVFCTDANVTVFVALLICNNAILTVFRNSCL